MKTIIFVLALFGLGCDNNNGIEVPGFDSGTDVGVCSNISPPNQFIGDCVSWKAAGNCDLVDGVWCPQLESKTSCKMAWVNTFDLCNYSCGRCK